LTPFFSVLLNVLIFDFLRFFFFHLFPSFLFRIPGSATSDMVFAMGLGPLVRYTSFSDVESFDQGLSFLSVLWVMVYRDFQGQ